MEEEYNWKLILVASIPIVLVEAYIFYTGISNNLKWFSLIIGMALAGLIVYMKSKRSNNIFTAAGIVFLAGLVMKFLKQFGIL